jgi:hypothetical protein
MSLAAAMQRRRRGTYFLSYLDPLSLATTIHRANNDWIAAETPVGGSDDLAATVAEVRAFCDAWGWTGRAATRADLEVIPRIRRRLRTAWTAPLEEAVELTNELLRDGRALPHPGPITAQLAGIFAQRSAESSEP